MLIKLKSKYKERRKIQNMIKKASTKKFFKQPRKGQTCPNPNYLQPDLIMVERTIIVYGCQIFIADGSAAPKA